MNKIYISKNANKILTSYLEEKGIAIEPFFMSGIVPEGLSCHPDMFLCKLGIHTNSPVFIAKRNVIRMNYPEDIAFNAACTGKYFIHNLSFTNEELLLTANQMDMKLINVRQGYSKCSIVIVDENSIITYDKGIAKACSKYPDLEVLLISPGFVRLDGYDTGFIGGASGRINNEIIFHGDLSAHPDFERIVRFIEQRNLKCKWFPEFELTDIGSII